jgi:2-oxoglutarate ferredoxin oxidoreductase subunit alpha
MKSVTWKIGGEAGFGIMSSGIMLARAFARAGYAVAATNDYPSLIRGGHNVITVRIAIEPFAAMNRDVHLLVALNAQTIEQHRDELARGAILVYDPAAGEGQGIPVPMSDIVKEANVEMIMRNTVALGASVALLGAEFGILESVIKDQFKKKGDEVVNSNVSLAKKGYDYIKQNHADQTHLSLDPGTVKEPQLVISGSEAFGVGAVRAGMKFAAIYPMTPINAVITFLADHAKSLGIVYKQPEDEIAGINMAIGASVAGARSMVATSGGGFALMVEGLSLAGMIETPLVIDLGMRVGPATGMPTYTEQGELQFAIHAGHGEFPRVVLAPADAKEAHDLAILAFNLADKYQIPVFVLTDKYLNESQWAVPKSAYTQPVTIDRGKFLTQVNEGYKRYSLDTPDGVSPRTTPGTKGGVFYANSYEHDETGHVTEAAAMRTKMAAKRLKKFEAIAGDVLPPQVMGDGEAELTFVSWGTSRGAILEAMKLLKEKGKTSRLVHFPWLFPFPADAVAKLLSPATRIIDVEQNATGQLASLIREHTGILVKEKFLKNDGRPWYPEEIVELCSK